MKGGTLLSKVESTLHALIVAGAAVIAQQSLAQTRPAAPQLDPPARPGAIAPNLTQTREGALLTWIEPGDGDGERRLRFSRFDPAGQWSDPLTIAERSDFFVNWADIPSIVVANNGSLLAHWLQKSPAAQEIYAYDVVLARSTDQGKTWQTLGSPHRDQTSSEHGFVSMLPEPDGSVRVFWLDGREMAAGQKHDHSRGESPAGGSMQLRTALVAADGSIGDEQVLDDRVCECCPTAAAVTSNGPAIVYRNRTEDDTRDIYIMRRSNEDGTWTNPRAVWNDQWQISGCPVNGGAIAAHGKHVAAAWYTAAEQRPRVLASFSPECGDYFLAPLEVDVNEPLGRVDVAIAPDGSALVCWFAAAGDDAMIRLRRFQADGFIGPAMPIGTTDASRSSGFPTIVAFKHGALVVWTDDTKPSSLRATFKKF